MSDVAVMQRRSSRQKRPYPGELGQARHVAISCRRRHVVRRFDCRLRNIALRQQRLGRCRLRCLGHQSDRAHDFLADCQQRHHGAGLAALQDGDKAQIQQIHGLDDFGRSDFSGLQAYEWTHLISHTLPHHNLSFSKDLFATTFFVLTGFHGMHVTGGVIYNICVLAAVNRGRYQAKHVEIAGLYWHFVDLVWILDFYFRLFALARDQRSAMSQQQPIRNPITSRFSVILAVLTSSKSGSSIWVCPSTLLAVVPGCLGCMEGGVGGDALHASQVRKEDSWR